MFTSFFYRPGDSIFRHYFYEEDRLIGDPKILNFSWSTNIYIFRPEPSALTLHFGLLTERRTDRLLEHSSHVGLCPLPISGGQRY